MDKFVIQTWFLSIFSLIVIMFDTVSPILSALLFKSVEYT